MTNALIPLKSFEEAQERIRPHNSPTPLLSTKMTISGKVFPVWLKMENQQVTGSFKERGSLNKLLILKEKQDTDEIFTASTGNHGLGIARALKITGQSGTIVLPKSASPTKLEKLRTYPVNLDFVDGTSLEAELAGKAKSGRESGTWISPYNDPDIIAGQGTIGLEIIEQLPQVDAVFVTVGGGGLISGIATVLKEYNPDICIIACQPANSAEMTMSVEKGEIVDVPYQETLSDGSAGGIEPGAITFPMCQQLIDHFVLINEDEIRDAIKWAWVHHQQKIEGAAGVAVAGFRKYSEKQQFSHPVIVICGGNIEPSTWEEIIS